MFNINFEEIDINDIATWPLFLKILVLIGALLLSIFITKWLFIDSKTEELDFLLREETKLKSFIVQKQATLVNIHEYKKQMQEIEERLESLIEQVPSDNKLPNLVDRISEAGKNSQLIINEVSILPEKKLKYYVELPIKIRVYGGYHKIGEFIASIANSQRIITFHDFNIELSNEKDKKELVLTNNSDNVDLLKLEVLAKTYRYNISELDKDSDEQEDNKIDNG